jgi:uncharacterized membrane protein
MELVPEWAPNVHPMFVHFPIALLFTAVGVDFLALVVRPWRWLRRAAVTIYVLGAVATIATYFTGTWAADSITLPAEAQTVLTEHATLAWWTMWGFGLYALLRLGTVFYERTRRSVGVHGALFALALAGLYLPYQTGDHGSMMVYKYGAGVQGASSRPPIGSGGTASDSTAEGNAGGGPQVSKSGAWRWQPAEGTVRALRRDTAFAWLAGEASALNPAVRERSGAGGPALALEGPAGESGPVMFTAGGALRSIQAEARLKLSGFDGTAMLVHHVQDANNYDFVALDPDGSGAGGGTMRLGRVRGGERSVSAEGTYAAQEGGWLPVRVVSDASHYRGYVGGEMVAHGHAGAPEPGRVGVRLEGSGTVLLQAMQVQRLQ